MAQLMASFDQRAPEKVFGEYDRPYRSEHAPSPFGRVVERARKGANREPSPGRSFVPSWPDHRRSPSNDRADHALPPHDLRYAIFAESVLKADDPPLAAQERRDGSCRFLDLWRLNGEQNEIECSCVGSKRADDFTGRDAKRARSLDMKTPASERVRDDGVRRERDDRGTGG
jgi:hypothetical protein